MILFRINPRAFLLLAGLWGASLLAPCVGLAQETPASDSSYVLLQNGNVLVGRISPVEGHYRVIGQGSEIRLRTSMVAHVGHSLQDLYGWRRKSIPQATVPQRLELAEWCIRQGLWPEASRELLEVRNLDSRQPMLPLLERRLQQAWRESQQRSQAVASSNPTIDPKMQETARAAQQLRVVEALPDGALERFTRKIQPILVNNCTIAGCHQPGGSESFQLNRDLLHGLASRRSTFANLASALAAIDRENPAASPLLLAASQPHAGKSMGVLTGRNGDLQEKLSGWVHNVANPMAVVEQSPSPTGANRAPGFSSLVGGRFEAFPSSTHQDSALPSSREPRPFRQPADVVPAMAKVPAGTRPTDNSDDQVMPAVFHQDADQPDYTPLVPVPAKRGAPLQLVAPRDEFDPAIFNRKYRQAGGG